MVAVMAIVALTANAQSNTMRDPGAITIQPKVGMGFGMLSGTYDSTGKDRKTRVGVVFGVEGEYYVNDWFGVALGMNYAQQGWKWKYNNGNKTTAKADYFNVPITANFYLTRGLALKTGVQFGFLVNAHSKYSVENKTGDTKVTSTTDTKCKDAFNKFDVSIPVGISYEFKVPIVLDLRYNIGLSKVGKKGTPFEDCRNGSLALTVGYKFNL